MPLALAVGRGDLTLPRALRLPRVREDRMVLVDARDTDLGEHRLLENSAVTRTSVIDLPRVVPTEGDIYVHVAVDVCTPAQIPDLLHPAEGGSDVADVLAAVRPQAHGAGAGPAGRRRVNPAQRRARGWLVA